MEHVIPESIGNKDVILDKGIVCDGCNQYIAIKIEKPLLEHPYFVQCRHDLNVLSKKGRIPSKNCFLIDDNYSKIIFHKDITGFESAEIDSKLVEGQLPFLKNKRLPVFTLTYTPPFTDVLMSKLLAKMAFELFVYEVRCCGDSEIFYLHDDLEKIRKYVRHPNKNQFWHYCTRMLYTLKNNIQGMGSTLFSWKFFITPDDHFLFQFLYMGTEFTMDLYNSSHQTLTLWNGKSNGISPVLDVLQCNPSG